MAKINYIQNKNVIPDTHIFVYNDKKYPFKFDYFKYASNYISRNQKELEGTKIINLINSESDENFTISPETIEAFINFVQGKKIVVNKSNVVELNYLSNEYEVPILIKETKEYIENHQEELVLEILIEKQNKY